MRLLELSNTSYQFDKINTHFHSDDVYEFTSVNGLKYYVLFNIYKGIGGTNLEIEFEVSKYTKGTKIGITGTGDQFKIFATIKNIVEHYLKSIDLNNIKRISFSADEPSRIKLYDKFVPIIQQMLGDNWEFNYTHSNYKLYKFNNKNFKAPDEID